MTNTWHKSAKEHIAEFHNNLFWNLVETEHEIPDILEMSLSEALLVLYGSIEEVDQDLGSGTYQAAKKSNGEFNSWRKGWGKVIERERLRHAKTVGVLAIFDSCMEACLRQGIDPEVILKKAEKSFSIFTSILQEEK